MKPLSPVVLEYLVSPHLERGCELARSDTEVLGKHQHLVHVLGPGEGSMGIHFIPFLFLVLPGHCLGIALV